MSLGIVGLSLVLLTGYSGQVSLCQFSFMGIGAFIMGKIAGGGSLLGLLAAALVCAGVGALIALPTIRLRDLYLALATFAFADAVAQGFFPDSHIYGSGGIPIGRIIIPGVSFGSDSAEFLLVTVFFVLAALLVLAIRRSLFGRRLVALNDSPAAYATVGLNIGFTKVAVFAIAAGMAGLAGALYGTAQGVVGTTDFDIFPGIIFVLFVTIWSIRTVIGRLPGRRHLCHLEPALAQRHRALRRGGHHPHRPGRRWRARYRGPPVPPAMGRPLGSTDPRCRRRCRGSGHRDDGDARAAG